MSQPKRIVLANLEQRQRNLLCVLRLIGYLNASGSQKEAVKREIKQIARERRELER